MMTMMATFTIEQGKEQAVIAAGGDMLARIRSEEAGTCLYLITTQEQEKGPTLLTTVEAYADKAAFDKHLAPGSAWDDFRKAALAEKWLVPDPGSSIGLKSVFATLELQGSLLRSALA